MNNLAAINNANNVEQARIALDSAIMRHFEQFVAEIPATMRMHKGLVLFVPYYILESVKRHYLLFAKTQIDINNQFSLYGQKIFPGYENYFVATILEYGAIQESAVFKKPIK